jgi:GGDEF domain-containing protein
MLGWFLLLFASHGLYPVPEISSQVPLFAAVLAIGIVCLPHRHAMSWATLVAPLAIFVVLSALLGRPLLGAALAPRIAELCVIAASILLARPVARCISEFEESVLHVMLDHLGNGFRRVETGQHEMYREVRRARTHESPMTMLALSIDDRTRENRVDALFDRVQRECIERYVDARMLGLIASETRDSDVITQKGECFFTLLTETSEERARQLADRLHEIAGSELGLGIRIGLARFPDQALTLDKLFEESESGLREEKPDASTERYVDFDRRAAEAVERATDARSSEPA